MKKFLKNQDKSGHFVSFTYKGKSDSYNTPLGGCISALMKILVYVIMVMLIQDMAGSRSNDDISNYERAWKHEHEDDKGSIKYSDTSILPYFFVIQPGDRM